MIDEDIHSCRSGIETLLRFLSEAGEDAIKYPKLDDEDLKYLQRGLAAIKQHKESLMMGLSMAEKKYVFLDSDVLNLLIAAYDIGKTANLTQTAKTSAKSKSQSAMGHKSGQARQLIAAETWHPKARELTVAALREAPQISKAAIIRHIRNNWPLATSLLPSSDKQIDRFISTIDEIKKKKKKWTYTG